MQLPHWHVPVGDNGFICVTPLRFAGCTLSPRSQLLCRGAPEAPGVRHVTTDRDCRLDRCLAAIGAAAVIV